MTQTARTFTALIVTAIVVLGSAASARAAVPARTETVTPLENMVVRAYPGPHAPTVATVADTRPLTGAPTVLPVIGTAQANGRPWVRVLLPQRPDSSSGWIPADGTRVGHTPWRVVVVRSERRAYIYHAGRVVRSFQVVVGKPSTPTPSGQFFVAEVVYEGYGMSTGPWALATSAYSNVLQEFDGGPGQVALHGRVGLPQPVGTASSHGCVRFDNQDITWMAEHFGAGTPVDIQ